jgi:hypothetical protein
LKISSNFITIKAPENTPKLVEALSQSLDDNEKLFTVVQPRNAVSDRSTAGRSTYLELPKTEERFSFKSLQCSMLGLFFG